MEFDSNNKIKLKALQNHLEINLRQNGGYDSFSFWWKWQEKQTDGIQFLAALFEQYRDQVSYDHRSYERYSKNCV